MALTFGFYNSIDGDRKYNAEQFGSIFDGIINDGVYMGIGGKMMVVAANNGMKVNIQTGRAWFDHTWTLNDTIYTLTLPNPEVLLDKYVAVVLETNKENGLRRNSIKYVAGEPSSAPKYPTLTNNATVKQHPLAYVLVKAGATVIDQSVIKNMVGTSSCPFVTGVVQSMNIDSLIAQWEAQWNQNINAKNTEFNEFMSASRAEYGSFKDTYEAFMSNASYSFNNFMEASDIAFDNFLTVKNDEFESDLSDMKSDFASFWDDFKAGMQEYLAAQEAIWENWFLRIQGQLSEDAATHLQNQIDALAYAYVDGNRAVLGVTAYVVKNKVVFGAWGAVDNNERLIVSAPAMAH